MKNVLSIQPHVVFGHVGNSAAVFPMQRLGVNVWPLETMQFSNHMQYGHWAGSAIDAAQMNELVEGIGTIGVLRRCDAVLSGYLSSTEQVQAVVDIVKAVKAANPQAWHFATPVIGAGAGAHVDEYLLSAMPAATDGLAPNHETLQKLVGRAIETVDEAVVASREIIARGPQLVLVKQLRDRNSPADRVNLLAVTASEAWMSQYPRYPFARQPVGVSELTSAIFVARRLTGDSVRTALEHTSAAVHAVLKATYEAGRYELELVAAQDDIARPREWLGAWFVGAA
ncbi:pyridoxal kinase PdxY [Paraburkholderia sp. NMBU_R16]|uniref:pyridoxal kinase PdxY n=1 Tax=Paraburkholderia sp. NMBU_R16 TaxID=2698676 RepID=UPI001566F15C|nr:pyridoxal kinase PdxY [Paraburkholderia sp. NMBU_R16]NRO97975.1 pyridoxal kinase PdxY [Paraburkholderia sp. NMBU_R16]